MGTQEITYSSFNEVVFENRFRQYGAYMLRKTYSDRLFIAALIGTSFITLLIAFPYVMQFFSTPVEKQEVLDKGTVTIVQTIDLEKDKPMMPKDQPKPQPQPTPPTKGISSNIQVSNDPNKQDINLRNDSLVAGDPLGKEPKKDPIPDPNPNPNPSTGTAKNDEVVLVAEVNPEPTCDIKQHISRNLVYPAYARDIGAQGTVYVSFVVDKEGEVTDVKVIRDIGYGCGEAAMNAVKSMCKWKPGKMGGQPVKVQCTLPIKFTLN